MSEKLLLKVLVIENDDRLRTSISNNIERNNFDVIRATTENTIHAIGVHTPSAAVISSYNAGDLTDLAQQLWSKFAQMPIVFMVENDEDAEKYQALSQELTTVIKRSDAALNLLPAIKMMLRKSRPVFQNKNLSFRNLSIDLATYRVTRAGTNIHLGPTEFKILHLLMQQPSKIFSREEIINFVWENNDGTIEPRTVDVHVNRLRTMLKAHPKEMSLIKTIRSSGYCLKLPGELD